MEEVIKIEGGHRLNGTVRISGSKNATVALIPAAVLAYGPVTICGVPNISDVRSLSVLLNELGVQVTKKQEDIIIIDPTGMENRPLVGESVSKLRASYYFMGALLGKYGRVEMKMPGGCYLGPRPIDLHLKGFEALGASVQYERGSYIIEAKELVGNKIFLDISSVGATINIMMAAVYAKGRTTIENAAKEPEIIDIATMLNKMGAHIRGMGTSVITIDGVDRLMGCFHEIIPDRIEAATYVVLAAAAADEMVIENIIPQHLDALLMKLDEIGIDLEVDVETVSGLCDGYPAAADDAADASERTVDHYGDDLSGAFQTLRRAEKDGGTHRCDGAELLYQRTGPAQRYRGGRNRSALRCGAGGGRADRRWNHRDPRYLSHRSRL